MAEKARSGEVDKDEFEEFVAAALKVDPKGLSGKHRKVDEDQNDHNGDAAE